MNLIQTDATQFHIIIIGAGGTGGWLASFIDRLNDIEGKELITTIIDGDIVEQKNLKRQNFLKQDVNHNKAEVIGSRYHFTNIISQFLKKPDELKQVVESTLQAQPIIVGAVDNNASRLLVKEFIDAYKGSILWIDAGNSERDGQVITSFKEEGEYVEGFKDPFTLKPELNDTAGDNRHPDDISCAEQSESAPQNIAANIFSATTLFGILNKWIAQEPLLDNEIKFNSSTLSMYQFEEDQDA